MAVVLITAMVVFGCGNGNTPEDDDDPYVPGVGLGTVSITGDLAVGNSIIVNTSALRGGTSTINTEFYIDGTMPLVGGFQRGDNPQFSLSFEDHGKTIEVVVQRDEWVEHNDTVSLETGPVVWGWRTRTIAVGVPNEDGTEIMPFRTSRAIEMDNDGMLYVYSRIAAEHLPNYGNEYHNIWKIDWKDIDITTTMPEIGAVNDTSWQGAWADPAPNTTAEVTLFKNSNTDHAWTAEWLGFDRVNDRLYAARVWGRDVVRYNPNAPSEYIMLPIPSMFPTIPWRPQSTTNPEPEALDGGLAVAPGGGTFFILDQYGSISNPRGHRVLKYDVNLGQISVLAGGVKGEDNSPNAPTLGTGSAARFAHPGDITVGHDGAVYVTDGYFNGQILRVDPTTGTVTNFVGDGWGYFDGDALTADFEVMPGITYGRDGSYYITDQNGSVIRRIFRDNANSPWYVTTIAGQAGMQSYAEGLAREEARFRNAHGITVTSAEDGIAGRPVIFVVDDAHHESSQMNRIRMIYFDDN